MRMHRIDTHVHSVTGQPKQRVTSTLTCKCVIEKVGSVASFSTVFPTDPIGSSLPTESTKTTYDATSGAPETVCKRRAFYLAREY
jgi:hypothetical protein